MQRLLAVVGAVAMIVVAIVVRSALDDSDEREPDRPAGPSVVVCDSDLAAYCEALPVEVEVRVEDSAVTAQSIVDGELEGADVWVTSAPWLEVVQSRRDGAIEAEALASSPVTVAAVDAERADAIDSLCDGRTTWRCLGDEAGREWEALGGDARWGTLKTGLPDADTSTGLAVLASVAAGFFDDTGFAANDFASDDFAGWLGPLTSASGQGDRDVVRSLVVVRGSYSAGGVLEADAAGQPGLVLRDADPTIDDVAVLVDLPGGDARPDAGPVRQALVEAGWESESGDPPATLKPGVAAALHTLWKDVTS